MTPDPRPSDDPDPDRDRLDVDARFAEIIAGWEPSPDLTDPGSGTHPAGADDPDEPPEPRGPRGPSREAGAPPEPPTPDRLRGLFQPAWSDPLDDEASWDDEGHFVPPPPPPLPQVDPHRRLAWAGLLGAPLVALLLIGAGIRVSGWMGFLLAVAFVGGFGYLVATMGQGPPDDLSGDDGARI